MTDRPGRMGRRALLRHGMLASGLVLGAPLLAACGGGGNDGKKAGPSPTGKFGAGSMRLAWLKTVEFAGSYVADTNGYYTAEGFSRFELIGGGPTATPVETDLVGGKALIGISAPDRVAAAVTNAGAHLKILGAQYQKNPFAMMSMAAKPIRTAKDMIGKKIGVQAVNAAVWAAFLKANHIDPKSLTVVPVQDDPLPLTTGAVDGWMSFITNEPNTLRLKGFKVETFLFADQNYPLVGEVYVVTDKTLQQRRDAIKAVLRAEIKGWKQALVDPALGARLAVDKYGKGLGLTVQEQTLESTDQSKLVQTADTRKNGLFTLTPDLVAKNVATLKFAGITVTADQIFDLSLLTEIYRETPSLI